MRNPYLTPRWIRSSFFFLVYNLLVYLTLLSTSLCLSFFFVFYTRNAQARIVRFHVKDEAAALEADAIVDKALKLMRDEAPPGLVQASRTVCKAEWAYEVEVVFEQAHFGTYMESSFRTDTMNPILGEMVKLAVDPENMYQGKFYQVFTSFTFSRF